MNPATGQISPRRQDGVQSRIETAILSGSSEIPVPAALPSGRAETVKRKVRLRMALDDRFLQAAMARALVGRNDIEILNTGLTEVFVRKV